MASTFPSEGVELTHILVVGDLARARSFYRGVLGADVHREYGGTSCVLRFQGSWLLLVTGGGPTEDKPEVVFQPPHAPNQVSHAMTIRVPDCRAAYDVLSAPRRQVPDAAIGLGIRDPLLLPRSGRAPPGDQRNMTDPRVPTDARRS